MAQGKQSLLNVTQETSQLNWLGCGTEHYGKFHLFPQVITKTCPSQEVTPVAQLLVDVRGFGAGWIKSSAKLTIVEFLQQGPFPSYKPWINWSPWGYTLWKLLHKNKPMKVIFFRIKSKLFEECKPMKARNGEIKSFSEVFLQSFSKMWDKPRMISFQILKILLCLSHLSNQREIDAPGRWIFYYLFITKRGLWPQTHTVPEHSRWGPGECSLLFSISQLGCDSIWG